VEMRAAASIGQAPREEASVELGIGLGLG
jgi:hypothetical protein